MIGFPFVPLISRIVIVAVGFDAGISSCAKNSVVLMAQIKAPTEIVFRKLSFTVAKILAVLKF